MIQNRGYSLEVSGYRLDGGGCTYQRAYGNFHTMQLDDNLLTKLNKLSSKKAAASTTEYRTQGTG